MPNPMLQQDPKLVRGSQRTIAELLLESFKLNTGNIADTATHFERCGYLPLRDFLTFEALKLVRSEVASLADMAKRKDFLMECMGNSPRHMSTVGGETLAMSAPGLVALYHDRGLQEALGQLLGLELLLADDPVERHVLNMLHRAGDTHGFHVDDYPIALVIFVESPDCDQGCGMLEMCADGQPDSGIVSSHKAGDAYMLRADRFWHRVQPVHEGCKRTALNFAFSIKGHANQVTPSASLLYS